MLEWIGYSDHWAVLFVVTVMICTRYKSAANFKPNPEFQDTIVFLMFFLWHSTQIDCWLVKYIHMAGLDVNLKVLQIQAAQRSFRRIWSSVTIRLT